MRHTKDHADVQLYGLGLCVYNHQLKSCGWLSDVIIGPLSNTFNPNCFGHWVTLLPELYVTLDESIC